MKRLLLANHVVKAIRIMREPMEKIEVSIEGRLRALKVFDYQWIKALLAIGDHSELLLLIDTTAKEIVRMYEELDEQERYKIKWIENTKKIRDSLEQRFPELFSRVKEEIRCSELYSNFEHRIKFQQQKWKCKSLHI